MLLKQVNLISLQFIFLERSCDPRAAFHSVMLRAILPLVAVVNITYNVTQLLLIGSVGGQENEWWDEGKESILKGMSQPY